MSAQYKKKNETRYNVDHKMEGMNLALESSCHLGIKVRVIQGLSCEQSSTNILCVCVCVCDGLYNVVKWWSEVGKSGITIYKFKPVSLKDKRRCGALSLNWQGN